MSRKNIKMVLFAALALVFANGCGDKESPSITSQMNKESPVAGHQDGVKHKVMSFDLEGLTDSGSKKWDVKGESAEAVSEDRVKLNKIVASTYGDDSQATISADKGVYDKSKNNVRLHQNVRATIENLKEKSNSFMDFSGVMSDKQKKEKSSASKKTRTVITCDAEAEFDYEKNMAYFNDNVRIENDEGLIDADKVTVYLDPSTKKITRIVADGNVKIARGDNITYSDRATYLEAEKKLLLTGEPRLVIYQDGKLKDNFLGN